MAKKKDSNKGFMVNIDPTKVMHTHIGTNKNGYNNASMSCKISENEYMSISYEWGGQKIPGFALDMMAFMQNQGNETSGVWEGQEKNYEEYSAKKAPKKKEEKEKDMKEEDTEDEDMEDDDKKKFNWTKDKKKDDTKKKDKPKDKKKEKK